MPQQRCWNWCHLQDWSHIAEPCQECSPRTSGCRYEIPRMIIFIFRMKGSNNIHLIVNCRRVTLGRQAFAKPAWTGFASFRMMPALTVSGIWDTKHRAYSISQILSVYTRRVSYSSKKGLFSKDVTNKGRESQEQPQELSKLRNVATQKDYRGSAITLESGGAPTLGGGPNNLQQRYEQFQV